MLTRLQKVAMVIALAICFVVAIGGEVWEASHPPQSLNQNTATTQRSNTDNQFQKESTEEAIARYSEWLTIFTGVLAAFTAILAVATVGLGIMNFFQLRLSRAEFIATHRPKIRVRRIIPTGALLPDAEINLIIEAANIGDTAATIIEIGMDVYIAGTPFNAIPRPYPNFPPAGPGKEARTTFATRRMLSEADIDAIEVGTAEWRLLGIINYTDDNGVMRSTSLARVYNRAMGRFIPVTEHDPDTDREFEN